VHSLFDFHSGAGTVLLHCSAMHSRFQRFKGQLASPAVKGEQVINEVN
jgi:hypothetical protein